MTKDFTAEENLISTDEDRKKLAGLLGFAQGVLTARAKVQMTMGGGLGVFREADIAELPGLHLDREDGAWFQIERQRETRPPEPEEHVATFLAAKPSDPSKPPQIKSAVAIEVSIEEASDLEAGGLLRGENVHAIVENGVEIKSRVKVTLLAEDCTEMQRDFERYVAGPWSDWARQEKPVRKAISLYNDLFKINSAIHTAEGTPPELVWGLGIARWDHTGGRVDMPLIEQLVDIEVEDGGAIAIRPRDLAPQLTLKPFLELEVDGAAKLQRDLQDRLEQLLMGEGELSPFTTLSEPLFDTAAAQLSSSAAHIGRTRIEAGEALPRASEDLCISSTWAIFGRPRSHEARSQDLEALRKRIEDEGVEIPASTRGYAAEPSDEQPADTSSWGLSSALLGGVGQNSWTPPSGKASTREPSATPRDDECDEASDIRAHFFPLPFNEEQGRISDMIDDPKMDVVCVSGPPGTGKSHSIANIISHQMATGKRVLVTARTPEAISAVREKLPASLQPLVIASVGTDRESAQQLQDAVSELSDTVVGLNEKDALLLKARLEQQIIDCNQEARAADEALTKIARANLAPLEWRGKDCTPMELVELLAGEQEIHGWFIDRPVKSPPAQLSDLIERLKVTLPALAADIVYAGARLPSPDDLPATAALVEAHETDIAHTTREVVDYSGVPPMARDSEGAEDQARQVLAEIRACMITLEEMGPAVRSVAACALRNDDAINRRAIENTRTYLDQHKDLDAISEVRFDLGSCSSEDFLNAAKRGAGGQKPVGFSLFSGALREAVASARLRGEAPASSAEWRCVLAACRLKDTRETIETTLAPFVRAKLIGALPREPWDLARRLKDTQAEMRAALELAARMTPICDALRTLFPYGLSLSVIEHELDLSMAAFALEGNLPDTYRSPEALLRLKELGGAQDLPVFSAISDLASALGREGTNPQQIVTLRGDITRELTRLAEVAPKLEALGLDLDTLSECGAPGWVARLKARPDEAEELIPSGWAAAWVWAQMSARVDKIIDLGNGDDHRAAKADAMRRRRKHFEELIRIRTLLGLRARMTPSVRQAMEAFTQAVSKIGTGKGKKAPRFIREAQIAARRASSAAPVWIMPEYKIPEQLPAEFGDFDLVILDEASQSDVTALAALARGKKILVVGDEQQVSPAAVGIPTQKINALRAQFLDGLPNSGLIDENSSIFEITKRMHPESHVMLREHFRCVAPIIQFSTRFYNNSLVPLRVPKASERFDPPLCDVFIPGATRQGKTNAFEARWIVDEIARIVVDPAHEGRDIGVISLIGAEQAEKIGRMLIEDERIGPEVIEKRRIIYGDARTMQGLERSIVFLSMVATPGAVRAQSTKADQQRINVAMSRAKDRLYLVRSVSPEDLSPNDIKADILAHFLDPMPDGRTATESEAESLMDHCDSGFEREVLSMLLEANFRVQPQVTAGGFSIDLVVEGSEDRRLAIELDGDQYHGPDVWERDMARQAALERAGWVFWRVFGSQWNANRDFWWLNLVETLTRMKIEPIGAAAIDERFTETIIVDPDFGECAESSQIPIEIDEVSAEDSLTRDAPVDAAPSVHAGVRATSEETRETDPETATANEEESSAEPKSERSASKGTFAADAVSEGIEGEPAAQRIRRREENSAASMPPKPQDVHNGENAQGNLDLPQNDLFAAAEARNTTVSVGSTVKLEKLGNGGGKMKITLVENGHDPEKGYIGLHTPLGQALLDAGLGERVEYQAGAYLREVRVLEIS